MDILSEFLNQNNFIHENNVSFKKLTSYKTGGMCRVLVHPKNKDELVNLLDFLIDNKIEFYIWGNGTNILASDLFYNGAIIKLDYFKNIEISDNYVVVESGYNLNKFATEMTKKGYSNFSSFTSIPGTIGGALYMNAGAYGSSIEDIIISATVLFDNKIRVLTKNGMKFSYRSSIFKNRKSLIILSAKFKLEKGNTKELLELIKERTQKRNETQPLDKPSAGSVFRNPTNDYAGRLIEEAGLKGYRIGGALISEKHANFIVNDSKATSYDILNLMQYTSQVVKNKYKIDLQTEQILFNFK